MTVHPISPTLVIDAKRDSIPDEVFEAFNELIAQNFNGRNAIIKQDDIVKLIIKKGIEKDSMFDNHWLDVEDIYRAAGWEVIYDKPAYNESYSATFMFTKSK